MPCIRAALLKGYIPTPILAPRIVGAGAAWVDWHHDFALNQVTSRAGAAHHILECLMCLVPSTVLLVMRCVNPTFVRPRGWISLTRLFVHQLPAAAAADEKLLERAAAMDSTAEVFTIDNTETALQVGLLPHARPVHPAPPASAHAFLPSAVPGCFECSCMQSSDGRRFASSRADTAP